MITRDEMYKEFSWLYPQIPAGEKRVKKYKHDYHRLLQSLDLKLWPELREALKDQSFMPYPIKLEKLIFKLQPKNFNNSSYQESVPDCAKCAGTGFISAYEKKDNYGWRECSYACDCTKGKHKNLPNYFENYPDFQFPWDRDKYPTYPSAYVHGMHDKREQFIAEQQGLIS